jgi:hypothetical protein
VGGVDLVDFGSVGAVDGYAIGLVYGRAWDGVGYRLIVWQARVDRFTRIVGWVGAVHRHSSPPSVGTQFRIRLTLATALGRTRFKSS